MFTYGCLFLYFNVLLCVFYKLQNNVLLWVIVLPVLQVTAPKPGFWFQMHILPMTTYLHLCLIPAHLQWALIMLVNRATTWQQLLIWYAVLIPREKSDCSEGSLHGVVHSSGLVSDFTNEAQINLELEKVSHHLKMRGRLGDKSNTARSSQAASSLGWPEKPSTWHGCFWHRRVGTLALIRCF